MDGVMEDYSTIEYDNKFKANIASKLFNTKKTDYLDILNMDSLQEISDILKLDKDKCLDFVSATVNFKYMSRIITQQVTRHRNGITQESQRYVNYKEAGFNTPIRFKPDKYSDDKVCKTKLGDYNMYELASGMMSVYEDLVDQGVEKEDARGYLPENVQCGKLFMTFNLRTLFMFLHLRLDPHAQAEVRMYAEKLADLTDSYAKELGLDDMYMTSAFYSEPLYKRIENQDLYNDIDEEV
jgi:flavin-dependent thymidylate synthase